MYYIMLKCSLCTNISCQYQSSQYYHSGVFKYSSKISINLQKTNLKNMFKKNHC